MLEAVFPSCFAGKSYNTTDTSPSRLLFLQHTRRRERLSDIGERKVPEEGTVTKDGA